MFNTEILEAAVCDYEKATGMDAVNYRGLPKRASLRRKLEAARLDVNWWHSHAHEVARNLDRAIGDINLKLGL